MPYTQTGYMSMGDLLFEIASDTKSFDATLVQIEQQLTGLVGRLDELSGAAGAAGNGFNDAFYRIAASGAALERLGGVISGIGEGLLGAVGQAVQSFSELDYATTNSAILADKGKGHFDQLKGSITDMAFELGEKTMFSANDAAQAMEGLIRRGISPTELSVKSLSSVLDLASATQSGFAQATQVASVAMVDWHLKMSDMPRIADSLTFATTNSALKMDDLGTALKYVGTVGSQLGVPLGTTVALLAKLKDAGLDASTAGTSLRQVFATLEKLGINGPTAQQKSTFERLGLDASDLNIRLHGIGPVLQTLATKFGDIDDIMGVFPVRAAAAAGALRELTVNNQIQPFIQQMNEAAGVTERVADKQKKSIAGLEEYLKSSFEVLTGRIGQLFEGPLKAVLPFISSIVDGIGEWVKNNKELASGIAEAAIDVGIFLTVAGGVATVIGGIVMGVTLLSPLGWALVPVFAAMAAAGAIAAVAFEAIKDRAEEFFAGLAGFTQSETADATGHKMDFLGKVAWALGAAWKWLREMWDGVTAGFEYWDWNEADANQWENRWFKTGQKLHGYWLEIQQWFSEWADYLMKRATDIYNGQDEQMNSWLAAAKSFWEQLKSMYNIGRQFVLDILDQMAGGFGRAGDSSVTLRDRVVWLVGAVRDMANFLSGPTMTAALAALKGFVAIAGAAVGIAGRVAGAVANAAGYVGTALVESPTVGYGNDYGLNVGPGSYTDYNFPMSPQDNSGGWPGVPYASDQQTYQESALAGGKAGKGTGGGGGGGGGGLQVHINGPVTVRSDADIEAVSQKLYAHVRDEFSRKGMGF